MSTTGQVDMASQRTRASRRIAASPEEIFAILADASKHALFDGSGTVRGALQESEQLILGSKFGMDMKMSLLPYRMSSTVVEFEPNRLIAWQHFGKHRWRYELEPIEEGTLVTETFDWSTSRSPKFIELAGYPKKHLPNIERTLERLAELVEE